jgi:hypothetical protein
MEDRDKREFRNKSQKVSNLHLNKDSQYEKLNAIRDNIDESSRNSHRLLTSEKKKIKSCYLKMIEDDKDTSKTE